MAIKDSSLVMAPILAALLAAYVETKTLKESVEVLDCFCEKELAVLFPIIVKLSLTIAETEVLVAETHDPITASA